MVLLSSLLTAYLSIVVAIAPYYLYMYYYYNHSLPPLFVPPLQFLIIASSSTLVAYSREAGEDFQEADRRQTLCDPSQGRQRGAIGRRPR